jgi:hypothetical protein
LTAVLRRERASTPLVQEELRRSAAAPGHDALYRPASPEALARHDADALRADAATRIDSARRADAARPASSFRSGPARAASDAPSRGSWRDGEAARGEASASGTRVETRRAEVSASPRGDDGWRAQSGAPQRVIELGRSERERDRSAARGDNGWRVQERSVVPRRSPDTPRPYRTWDAPRREELRREEVRREDVRRDAPRYDAAPRPQARAYEPRYETRQAPRYEARPAPPRFEAPRAQPQFQPRSAPPRVESHPAPRPASPPSQDPHRRG